MRISFHVTDEQADLGLAHHVSSCSMPRGGPSVSPCSTIVPLYRAQLRDHLKDTTVVISSEPFGRPLETQLRHADLAHGTDEPDFQASGVHRYEGVYPEPEMRMLQQA